MTPRIYADFHNLDDANRIRLTSAGTREDLARQNIQLCEGLALTLFMDDADDDGRPNDLLADATIHFNSQEACWVAAVDWSALRHASGEKIVTEADATH